MIRPWLLIVLLFLTAFQTASAHEVRPAFLKATQTDAAQFDISFKQPLLDGRRLKISPTFPPQCATRSPRQILGADTVTQILSIGCDLKSGIIKFDGLDATLTDIFVQIDYADGSQKTALIKPEYARLDLAGPDASPARAYLGIGIDHVLRGWDHLLFIIGLTLLVKGRQVIGVATAFTLAHSVTLIITAMGWITVPARPVEILIAASIVLLAVEIMRKWRGVPSLAAQKPWAIAGLIGLIHGLGFAGALTEIGLPKGAELFALLLFNLGVEIGQIGVIIVTLLILWGALKLSDRAHRGLIVTGAYAIGAIGMFWTISRLADYWV